MTMERFDVAVIGCGAMGAAALWRLAARGATVIGFDRFAPPHDRGSSHGESRIIRTAYFEGPAYVPLAQRSFQLWRDLEAESGAALLTVTGALMIGSPTSAVVAGALASAEAHGLAHERLDHTAMARRYPQHRLAAGEVAIYEADAGFLRPEAGVAAALRRAEALGATVRRDTPIEAIEPAPDGGSVRIMAGGATYEARHAVVAAGSWLGKLLPQLRLPLRVERQAVAWFPLDDPAPYDPSRFPVFIRELPSGRSHYGFPTLDGTTIKFAVHHEGATTTADGIDRTVHDADLAPLYAYAESYLRSVEPRAVRSQVCMYTDTPDDHFIIGAPPGLPALTILGGGSGHAYKFAPVIGDIAADLALTGYTNYPIDLFAPGRFA